MLLKPHMGACGTPCNATASILSAKSREGMIL